MDEGKIRVDCYLNNGKKSNGKRAVLNKRWHWKSCMKKIAEKLGTEITGGSVLYSIDGTEIQDVDEIQNGEKVFFDARGGVFQLPPDGAPAPASAAPTPARAPASKYGGVVVKQACTDDSSSCTGPCRCCETARSFEKLQQRFASFCGRAPVQRVLPAIGQFVGLYLDV